MRKGQIQLYSVFIYTLLQIVFGWLGEIQGDTYGAPSAGIDRIVDRQWVVYLVGTDEREWILPLASLQHVGAMSEHEAEGLLGHLAITECSRQPCDPPMFVVDYASTREVYDRMETKIAVLRARGSASLTASLNSDRAAAAVPSSRGCVERPLR